MDVNDLKSRAAGLLCVIIGTILVTWAWWSRLQHGHYDLRVALTGPTIFVLGVGLLVHGKGIPTSGVTRLTRAWGLAGGMATIISLYFLGFFSRTGKHRVAWLLESALPFLLLFVWALPQRFFGDDEATLGTPTPSRSRPIEPE